MIYRNPIVKGFYPDPSVCRAGDKFYMVCSSFQYFPGVPLFESDDLVNWKQIGHVLTRKSQVMLEKINSSGGVFAPTIRYNHGRFYMVTTNSTTQENFYVYTDDIYGEWSEPITVEQGGIDPSLYFEDGRAYFMSNGIDENGRGSIIQCEIEIETGRKLTDGRIIWQGTGGRYLESPHLYKIGDYYYIMAAEGGTEYGHMITYARSDNMWGGFEPFAGNPVLTNRNKAPFIIQGIGHGDLICGKDGEWYIISLGFRQIGDWDPYHHLGREVFMTPVHFGDDGWFRAGTDGTTDWEYEINGDFVQDEKRLYTFENTDFGIDWCYLRHPEPKNYELSDGKAVLHGCNATLNDVASPTFVGIRQRDFCGELSCRVSVDGGEAGVTAYMSENEHYEIALVRDGGSVKAVLKLNIGTIHHVENEISVSGAAELIVRMNNYSYEFFVNDNGTKTKLGYAQTKYLSTEVSSGFTGVVLGLYAVGENTAEFTDFRLEYK